MSPLLCMLCWLFQPAVYVPFVLPTFQKQGFSIARVWTLSCQQPKDKSIRFQPMTPHSSGFSCNGLLIANKNGPRSRVLRSELQVFKKNVGKDILIFADLGKDILSFADLVEAHHHHDKVGGKWYL
jgi:hypothetical protein